MRNFQVFSACDFIAPIFITVTQYIPYKRFQMVRYYGCYFNKMCSRCRKRAEEAQEESACESAATAEQWCGAKVSAAFVIIERILPFVLQYRTVTLIASNRHYIFDLSGTRSRRWKSEFLSIFITQIRLYKEFEWRRIKG